MGWESLTSSYLIANCGGGAKNGKNRAFCLILGSNTSWSWPPKKQLCCHKPLMSRALTALKFEAGHRSVLTSKQTMY